MLAALAGAEDCVGDELSLSTNILGLVGGGGITGVDSGLTAELLLAPVFCLLELSGLF